MPIPNPPEVSDLIHQAILDCKVSKEELKELAGPEDADGEDEPVEYWTDDGTRYREFPWDQVIQMYDEDRKVWVTRSV